MPVTCRTQHHRDVYATSIYDGGVTDPPRGVPVGWPSEPQGIDVDPFLAYRRHVLTVYLIGISCDHTDPTEDRPLHHHTYKDRLDAVDEVWCPPRPRRIRQPGPHGTRRRHS